MTERVCKRESLKEGLIASIPIVLGYFPIAIAFGLLSKNTSLSLRDTSLLSSIVYAGAGQFMALDLISAGVNSSSIIMAIFLLNIRYLVMSASLSVKLENIPKKFLPVLGFGISDETFSVVSFSKSKINLAYLSMVFLLPYLSWNIGTIVGYFVGEILTQSLQASLSVGLYAMFAALLFPEAKKNKRIFLVFIISAAIYALIYYLNIFPAGWDIILAIIVASALGTTVLNHKEEENVN